MNFTKDIEAEKVERLYAMSGRELFELFESKVDMERLDIKDRKEWDELHILLRTVEHLLIKKLDRIDEIEQSEYEEAQNIILEIQLEKFEREGK